MCENAAACSKLMGPQIQQKDRSSSDYAAFISARTIYTETVATYNSTAPYTPKFKSNADYMKWKRVTANLYSVAPANLPVIHTCSGCGQ